MALTRALDFMEIDALGVASGHSKRVAYLSLRLGEAFGLPSEKLFDLVTLALLHDNGVGHSLQSGSGSLEGNFASIDKDEEHCSSGEANLEGYPFLEPESGIIANHHENFDGSGLHHLAGEAIPLLSRFIRFADALDLGFDLNNASYADKRRALDFAQARSGSIFDPLIVEAFEPLILSPALWLDLKGSFINRAIDARLPRFHAAMSWTELASVTKIFSRIIDSKSRFTRVHSQELSIKAAIMGRYYEKGEDEVAMLRAAADLHDVGKLAVSNAILEKPGPLDPSELDVIKTHTYYTRVSLEPVEGFAEIAEWAANHHERLDGSGYPYGKDASQLDFNSRLLACLDVYQALVEERPYRPAMAHDAAASVLGSLAERGGLDAAIAADVVSVFGRIALE
jgi:HD-GYP domain